MLQTLIHLFVFNPQKYSNSILQGIINLDEDSIFTHPLLSCRSKIIDANRQLTPKLEITKYVNVFTLHLHYAKWLSRDVDETCTVILEFDFTFNFHILKAVVIGFAFYRNQCTKMLYTTRLQTIWKLQSLIILMRSLEGQGGYHFRCNLT